MSTTKLNIGLIQFESELVQPETNRSRALRMIEDAAAQGANIICLPELFSTGYNQDIVGPRLPEFQTRPEGEFVQPFCETARRLNVGLIVPIPEQNPDGEGTYNSAVFIDPSGKIAGVQRKVHLFEKERNYFLPGEAFHTFQMFGTTVSAAICYDASFPESVRTMVLMGAEVIFAPSAWRVEDRIEWDLVSRARALENSVYVCFLNRVGVEEDVHMFGESRILDNGGKVLIQAGLDREETIIHEIDPGKLRLPENKDRFLDHRVPSAYRL